MINLLLLVSIIVVLTHFGPLRCAAQDDGGDTVVRCASSSNQNCPLNFPICCDSGSYCVSAGDKCCFGDSCNPGETCCSSNMGTECCSPGNRCDSAYGCLPDHSHCSRITDPGLCVSQVANLSQPGYQFSACSWDCANGVCVSPNDMNPESPSDSCSSSCNMWMTCLTCTSSVAGGGCEWDSTKQVCRIANSIADNTFAAVSVPSMCQDVLYGGQGLYQTTLPSNSLMNFKGLSTNILISFAVVCCIGLMAVMIKVVFLIRAHEISLTTPPEELVRATEAVDRLPRYGFEEAEVAPTSTTGNRTGSNAAAAAQRKKNFRRVVRVGGGDANALHSDDDDGVDGTCCQLCGGAMGNESRRHFVATDGERPAPWTYVQLLPCYHKVCRPCVLRLAERRHHSRSRGIGALVGGLWARVRGTSDANAEPSESQPMLGSPANAEAATTASREALLADVPTSAVILTVFSAPQAPNSTITTNASAREGGATTATNASTGGAGADASTAVHRAPATCPVCDAVVEVAFLPSRVIT